MYRLTDIQVSSWADCVQLHAVTWECQHGTLPDGSPEPMRRLESADLDVLLKGPNRLHTLGDVSFALACSDVAHDVYNADWAALAVHLDAPTISVQSTRHPLRNSAKRS